MKIFYTKLCWVACAALFSMAVSLSAQDTIVLQTFQYGSSARSGAFDFPDIHPDSLERILLGYNMRCHNGAPGGCGEWDYICNTYLTDSTRVDSTPSSQKRYLVANLDFDNLPLRTQQVYDYLYRPRLEFDFDNIQGPVIGGPVNAGETYAPSNGRVMYKVFSPDSLQKLGYQPGSIQLIQFYLQTGAPGHLTVYIDSSSQNNFPEGLARRKWTYAGSLGTDQVTGLLNLSLAKPFYWSGNTFIVLKVVCAQESAAPYALSTDIPQAAGLDFESEPGYAFHTDNNSYIGVPQSVLDKIDQQITLAFWAYGTDSSANVRTFFANGADAGGTRNLNLHLPWENNEIFWDCGGTNGSYDRINVVTTAADCYGRWNYWAFTKDASQGVMEIYLNGKKIQSGTGKTLPIKLDNLKFFKSPESNTGYFGMVDEISLWSQRLSEAQIRELMLYGPSPAAPHYAALESYYRFDQIPAQEELVRDYSAYQRDGALTGVSQYQPHHLVAAPYSFVHNPNALSAALISFEADRTESNRVDAYDSIGRPGALVEEYEKINTTTIGIKDRFTVYLPAYSRIYDGSGALLSRTWMPANGNLVNSTIHYVQINPARYQMLSFVTPYGNGLNLGPQGKTWFFDMTEYAPILRGKKWLSLEGGGQNQEEMDLKFYYVKGRPARKVLDIVNVYRPETANINAILSEKALPDRLLVLPEADAYTLRAEITGHGQDGEFIPRQHEFAFNGNAKKETITVWKHCGGIPIYPQGGTWIFDRAGWCPGDPSQVFRFDISDQVKSEPTPRVSVNYNVLGGTAPQMDYVHSVQVVSYAEPTFAVNASILDIIRPSNRVEFSRFNPACGEIRFSVINRGKTALQSLDIEYKLNGTGTYTDKWTGNLAFGDTAYITLSRTLFDLDMIGAATQLELSLLNPNGVEDEYPRDNYQAVNIPPVENLTFPELILEFSTNKVPQDNQYRLIDDKGTVILARDNMTASTQYRDTLHLAGGCYRLEVQDAGGDGLAFWFTNATTGTGSISFRRKFNNIYLTAKSFNPDFGSYLYYDFRVDTKTATDDLSETAYLNAYPNPANGRMQIEVGQLPVAARLSLTDLQGRALQSWSLRAGEEFNHTLEDLQAGMYLLRIEGAGGLQQVMKLVGM